MYRSLGTFKVKTSTKGGMKKNEIKKPYTGVEIKKVPRSGKAKKV